MIGPPVEVLRAHAVKVVTKNHQEPPTFRLSRLTQAMYHMVKTRGYKVIGKSQVRPLIANN